MPPGKAGLSANLLRVNVCVACFSASSGKADLSVNLLRVSMCVACFSASSSQRPSDLAEEHVGFISHVGF